MFSRQMAVMKGQAWNVVETLKTPDHGPLELTRRAKVCVWDDLVDVPVAVPMRMASSEMHRKAEPALHDVIQEEMDIGASNSSSVPINHAHADDLLGNSNLLPNSGRFELATSPRGQSPIRNEDSLSQGLSTREQARPLINRVGSRSSYQGPSRLEAQIASSQTYHRSSFALGRRHSNTIAQQLHNSNNTGWYNYEEAAEDDVEGDLGYAAAEGMEGNRRKVIVERLEAVKARNPVFTWC